ncbi:portal protein [Caulobacter phage CcrBL10]|uniref:Portal protein n=1 Tax=Caulobacter phage CcrBL10 TaxID=2283269 RepID=A0A385E939_9CAUD|nr:portal protein [Caulobacter phage CcrBL10]AXQ68246.1 portal protein [Caulobacter phage CcrBL10]
MAGQTPNSTNISRVARATSQAIYLVTHPEYQYWRPEWTKLRDVMAGQREIKRKAEAYLPAMKGADGDDYAIYLQRATFFNMLAQTRDGMTGMVFRRDPIIKNLPPKFKDAVRRFAKDGSSHATFAKAVLSEQAGVGRFGVLVDVADSPVRGAPPSSFAVGYSAENILDWDEVVDMGGFYVPSRVLLREFVRDLRWKTDIEPLTTAQARKARAAALASGGSSSPMVRQTARTLGGYSYITVYRELKLEEIEWPSGEVKPAYVQYLYEEDPESRPIARIVPNVRGEPLDFIPFKFFGASGNTADVEKPPLLDICDLNLSHYRTYAELEYGRLFTALPVYYAPGTDSEGTGEYHIGPNMVWEVPQGSEPGILEYTGQGLKALETALNDKERQIAAIGGRMMPGASKSVSESNNQTVLREANEQSLLLNIIQACEGGMTDIVRWWLMWRDVPLVETQDLRYEVNTDFLSTPIGAREMRAIQLMANDGLLPDPVFYEYMRKAEVISSDMTFEEFQSLRADENSFLNNPDAQARQRGFTNRGQELEQSRMAREADFTQQKIDIQERSVAVQEGHAEVAHSVGSTSVSASRKLGDPEQAKPAQAEQAQIANQRKQIANAAKTPAQPAAPAAPASQPGNRRPT